MYTGLQIINEIEDRLGWRQSDTLESDVSKETRKILRLLNRVLKNLVAAEVWPLLRADGTIVTQASVTGDARVSLTKGSVVVALDAVIGTPPFTFQESHKEWAIQFGPNTPIYRIAKIVTPLQIELNRPWLGNTIDGTDADVSPTGTVLGMDRYVLPEDFDRPTGKWRDFLSAYSLVALGSEEFAQHRRKRGRNLEASDPTCYTVYGLDPTNTYQLLHLDPWPKDQRVLEFNYQRVHPDVAVDTDLVLFPQSQISIVIESILYLANRDYEDDAKLQVALHEYLTQFKAAKSQNRITDDVKRLTPWRSRRRKRGAPYDYGDYFDRVDAVGLE